MLLKGGFVAKYVCIRKCFFQVRLYEEGDVLNWDGDKNPPHHFKKINGDIAITEVKKVEEVSEDGDEDVIEKLRAEHEAIGSSFDRRWGKTKLEHALIIFKKDKGIE